MEQGKVWSLVCVHVCGKCVYVNTRACTRRNHLIQCCPIGLFSHYEHILAGRQKERELKWKKQLAYD